MSTVVLLENLLLVSTEAKERWESEEELLLDIDRMFLANKYVHQFYERLKSGTLDNGFLAEFSDALAECNVNPYLWLDNANANVGLLLNSGVLYAI